MEPGPVAEYIQWRREHHAVENSDSLHAADYFFADLSQHPVGRVKTAIVLLAVPFSLVGAFWLLYLLHYNMSVAVWVGLIALAGLDAETGVVMLLYLDHAWEKFRSQGRMATQWAICAARSLKVPSQRKSAPKIMTVCAIPVWFAAHHVVAHRPRPGRMS